MQIGVSTRRRSKQATRAEARGGIGRGRRWAGGEKWRLLRVERGVEVNKTTPAGFTALMIASLNGHVDVVRLLLARQGVEVNTHNGSTALYIAQAAREREADAALRAAMTTTAFRLAQARQLNVRMILLNRSYALVRDARVSYGFARLFYEQRLEEFKLAQAESAARFALRHNGQNRLQGATRALAAAITALVAERAERDNHGTAHRVAVR